MFGQAKAEQVWHTLGLSDHIDCGVICQGRAVALYASSAFAYKKCKVLLPLLGELAYYTVLYSECFGILSLYGSDIDVADIIG